MEKRKVVWHTPAYVSFSKTANWYYVNCGTSFAKTYIEDVDSCLDTLAQIPTIGKVKRIIGKKHYAEYVTHPKTKIRYWFNDKEIHSSFASS